MHQKLTVPVEPDTQEIAEWIEAFDQVVDEGGTRRGTRLLDALTKRAQHAGVDIPVQLNTPYLNTIPVEEEAPYPGDRGLERRIKSLIRWNAMAMVHRQNKKDAGIGGHISTYSSLATLLEVGFNHFFHATYGDRPGDFVYFQGHASPGVYARAFLEGRLSQERLENRNIIATTPRKVWAFVGDGETDEPESMGSLTLASREKLDNLIFVVNCNLQRLDGPVRGNGKIIQELEAAFRGAGWNVIKVIWGGDWDALLSRDKSGKLVQRMNEVVDGEFQKYTVESGAYFRQNFFGTDPRLLKMVEHLSDEDLFKLRRGGHDPRKVYNAYKAAMETSGQPTVIL